MSDLREVVLDVETQVNGPEGKRAHPKFGNRVVLFGTRRISKNSDYISPNRSLNKGVYDNLLLIGHNIKFDLLHSMCHTDPLSYKSMDDLAVWDTQLAEYLLSGQVDSMTTLDSLSEKYGGTLKPDVIKDMWKAGVKTEDMDKTLLSDYLRGDLKNTEIVYRAQIAELAKRPANFQALVATQMDVVKALTVVEYNGMCIDMNWLYGYQKDLDKKLHDCSTTLDYYIKFFYGPEAMPHFNKNSNQHLAALLGWDGKPFSYKEKQQVGHYKNGKPKYKLVDVTPERKVPWAVDVPTSAAGNPSMDESWLNRLADNKAHPISACHIAQTILDIRGATKELSTYVEGLVKHSAMGSDGNCYLYGNFNQCLTRTGRLSSSNPNLQNINGKSPIKRAFVSRFGDKGRIVELDYSQLEVIALAVLSGDLQLQADIAKGNDLHYETGRTVFGWKSPDDMDKETRRKVKGVNFGLIYGGSANGLAATTGFPVDTVRKLIDAFYTRYPGVKQWQDDLYREVDLVAEPVAGKTTPKGTPMFSGGYYSPTGRYYSFNTYDAPEWLHKHGVLASFSPTEIKNYQVQGTATGDVVPMALARLCSAFVEYHESDKAYLTCTVHDSIIIDVREEYVDEVIELGKSVMESMPTVLENTFGWSFPLPLKVGVSVGLNWKDQEEI